MLIPNICHMAKMGKSLDWSKYGPHDPNLKLVLNGHTGKKMIIYKFVKWLKVAKIFINWPKRGPKGPSFNV